jgi:hypothetical protein
MTRYLIVLLLVCAVFWLLRTERRAAIRRRAARAESAASKAMEGEAIVGCAQCALHLPISEAVAEHSVVAPDRKPLWFCCEAHRALYEKSAGQEADSPR